MARLLVRSLVRACLESLCTAKNIASVRMRRDTCSTTSGDIFSVWKVLTVVIEAVTNLLLSNNPNESGSLFC